MFEKNSTPMGSIPKDSDDMGDKLNKSVSIEDIDSEYTIEVLVEDFAMECRYGLAVDYTTTLIEGDK